jgi:hypothetical protein
MAAPVVSPHSKVVKQLSLWRAAAMLVHTKAQLLHSLLGVFVVDRQQAIVRGDAFAVEERQLVVDVEAFLETVDREERSVVLIAG